jgi:hypothetical protein
VIRLSEEVQGAFLAPGKRGYRVRREKVMVPTESIIAIDRFAAESKTSRSIFYGG